MRGPTAYSKNRGRICNNKKPWSIDYFLFFKGQSHKMDIFLEVSTFSVHSMYALLIYKVLQK
jgi:hypothetical protein